MFYIRCYVALIIMKANEPMSWTKKQTQQYGLFLAGLGAFIGSLITYGLMKIIPLL